jgi:mannosyl-oligosaccharide alpha-1,2-mannosidase
MPYNEINFCTGKAIPDISNISQVGTDTLEFYILSKHTGDDTYRQLAEKGVRAIIGLADPLPYLPAQEIDPSTGEFTDKYVVSSAFVANVTMIHLTDRHGEEDQIVTLSI